MRLKHTIHQNYTSSFNFWKNACQFDRRECCYPHVEEYQEICKKIWLEWHEKGSRGKLPVMPPEKIQCEKCKYANLTLGRYQGKASLMVISRHRAGTIPVPIKGRKNVWLDNINQKQLTNIIKDISPDLEAFAISGSPSIIDFSFLEQFPKLKIVDLWWNNKIEKLWDMTKTPEVEFLRLDTINRLSNIAQLQKAKKLRYLEIINGSGSLCSLKPLENHPTLEFFSLTMKVADLDIRPLITIQKLKYLHCHFNLFDIDSYAMFEIRRPDVYTTFFEGLSGFEFEKEVRASFVGLVGRRQGLITCDEQMKQKKHQEKYLLIKEKYIHNDFIPTLKSTKVIYPVDNWRESIEDNSKDDLKEQFDEIEKILTEYANRMSSGIPKSHAKNLLKDTFKKLVNFNERTHFIETEERQDIYDYLSSFINQKWYDEFEELLSEADL